MEPSVFISYSSKEFEIAEEIRSRIEKAGVGTWMAPASIEGGSSYAEQIPRAIRTCDLFVLVLSRNAMASIWVSREVDRALNEGKRILPFVIENSPLTDEYNFYLTNVQRYPAYRDFETELCRLIRDIRTFLGVPEPAPQTSEASVQTEVPPSPKPEPAQEQPAPIMQDVHVKASKPAKTAAEKPKRKKKLLIIIAAAMVLLACVLLAVFIRPGQKTRSASVCGKDVDLGASYLSLSNAELTAADTAVIKEMSALSNLIIENCRVTVTDLSSLVGPALTSLKLTNCQLTSDQLKSLPLAGSQISTLNLSGNIVEDLSLFTGCEQLRNLILNGCGITDLAPLYGNQQITQLSLNDNDISDLSPLSNCESLRSLSLENNRHVTDIKSLLTETGRITELNISGTGVRDLSALEKFTNLTRLSVRGDELESLHGLEKALRLSYLDAAGNRLASLEGLENATVLTAVDLSNNDLTDVSILSKSAPKLKALLLQGNRLSSFVPAESFPELERLNVADNSLASLGQATFPKLKHLCVSGNPDFTELPDLPDQLHCLYAAGCRLTQVVSCFAADNYLGVLDLRDTPVNTLVLAAGRYDEIILTGTDLSDESMKALTESSSFELYVNYRDSLDYDALKNASYRIYLVGCPLDRQVAVESVLRNVTFLDKAEDADATIDPVENRLTVP